MPRLHGASSSTGCLSNRLSCCVSKAPCAEVPFGLCFADELDACQGRMLRLLRQNELFPSRRSSLHASMCECVQAFCEILSRRDAWSRRHFGEMPAAETIAARRTAPACNVQQTKLQDMRGESRHLYSV